MKCTGACLNCPVDRDLAPDRRKIQILDPLAFARRHDAARGAAKADPPGHPENADAAASGTRKRRPDQPRGFPRGSAQGGIFPDRDWKEPQAHFNRDVRLGLGFHEIQKPADLLHDDAGCRVDRHPLCSLFYEHLRPSTFPPIPAAAASPKTCATQLIWDCLGGRSSIVCLPVFEQAADSPKNHRKSCSFHHLSPCFAKRPATGCSHWTPLRSGLFNIFVA